MKSFSAEALAALASGEVVVSGAVLLALPEPLAVWGGFGDLVIDDQVYVGIGDRGLVSASSGTLGGVAQGAELILSGVDPDVLAGLPLRDLRGVPAILHRLIFDGSGSTPLHFAVFLRGRVDRARTVTTPGGTAEIRIDIEGAARGLGQRSERMRTDADQRLIDPNDGSLRRVAYAGTKEVMWGGKPPERAASLTGGRSI